MNPESMLKTVGIMGFVQLMAKCAALSLENPEEKDPIFNQTFGESYRILRDYAVEEGLCDKTTPTLEEIVVLVKKEFGE